MDLDNRLTLSALNETGCLNMLRSMLKMMSREFQSAYREYLIDPTDIRAYEQYIQIRNEFLSDYFHTLTRLDGRWVVKKLEKMVKQDIAQCA